LSSFRNLAQLDLEENDILDRGGNWLNAFPDTHTSLVSLNFATVYGAIDFECLERLVDRSKGLKSLKVPKEISLEQLQRLLIRAPQLTELGTGSYSQILRVNQLAELSAAFNKCKGLRSMSGFWEVAPVHVRSLYPVCLNLTSLNLSDVMLQYTELSKLIVFCHNLERLLVS
jgi:transport inhibitor response 1